MNSNKFKPVKFFYDYFKPIMVLVSTVLFSSLYFLFIEGIIKNYWTTLSTILGIASYFISIFLLDSTKKIRKSLKEESRNKVILKENSNQFMSSYVNDKQLIEDFIELIFQLKNQLEVDGKISDNLKENYITKKYEVGVYIQTNKYTISEYSDNFFDVDSYISNLNKTKPQNITRNLSQTLTELNYETIKLSNLIIAIPELMRFP